MALRCHHCTRTLADTEALFSRVKAKHGLKAARACVPDHPAFVREAQRRAADQARQAAEPSMADLVIEATLDRAMGLPVDRDIAEMFDV
ncbi:MAG: hypothetical protein MIL41_00600 [Hyphomicrobiales bacterium]|jgi:hypothetical protein